MRVPAYAKLNLTLEVLGRRSDGYHEVRTILQTIDLADQLDIQPAPGLVVECDDPSLAGEANLVWRAAAALAQHRGIRQQAHISIRKRIPVGMGLGGGSSDAAAALLALNRLWGLALPLEELAAIASGVGSDVAFFLWGGTALAQGRGEQVRPLPPMPSVPVTLVCPDITIPSKTARMYARLTPAHYTDGAMTDRLAGILERGECVVPDMLCNVFEEVAPQVFPDRGRLWQQAQAAATGRLHLSGAGPAMFCLPSSEAEHRRLADALQPHGVGVYLVRTLTPAAGPEPEHLE